jgi:ribonuclease HII
MVFIAGIDEAGYGPFVGPFVVGFSCFRVPDWELDLWGVLQTAARPKPARSDRNVIWLNDSKKVHSGKYGRERLERSVAAFLELIQPGLGTSEQGLDQFVRTAPSGPAQWIDLAPWLGRMQEVLCPSVHADRSRLDAAAIRRALEPAGCALDDFGCRMVPAGEWNDWIETTDSKAETLFEVTMDVVRHLLARTGHAPLRIELDQHGARRQYGPRLARALSPDRVERHGENRGGSAYTLYFGERAVQFRFSQKADETHAPVSLASLAAKLVRERAMDRYNAWWAERVPQVAPTKGYGVDGKRWLAEMQSEVETHTDPALVRRIR